MKMSKYWAVVAMIFATGLYSQNLVPNGDFENWTDPNHPTSWAYETGVNVYQHANTADTVFNGSYSCKVVLITQTQSNTDFTSDFMPVTSGDDYIAIARIFDNDPAGKVRLNIEWYDASQSYISTSWGNYSSDGTTWQEVSYTATAPTNASYAKVKFRFYDISSNWDGDAVFYIDSVEFYSTAILPESLTIYQIQGQTSSSPYAGSRIVTYGRVSGVYSDRFSLEEAPGGAWHGIWVYTAGAPTVSVGDSIRIEADVTEYYGLTELTNPFITVKQSGLTPFGPTTIALADIGEAYEGVLTQVNNVTVANGNLGYGEWSITDGTDTARVDDRGSYTYVPSTGDSLNYVIGPLDYSYGKFKMQPRDDNDISVKNYIPDITNVVDSVIPGTHVMTVIADLSDPDNGIVDDTLYYSTDNLNWTGVYHDSITTVLDDGRYWYSIPPQGAGLTVYYFIMAKDGSGWRTTSDIYSYVEPPTLVSESNNRLFKYKFSVNPNPMKNGAEINLAIPATTNLRVSVVDAAGRIVKSIYNGRILPGNYSFKWYGVDYHGRVLPSGIYFVVVKRNSKLDTRRLVIIR